MCDIGSIYINATSTYTGTYYRKKNKNLTTGEFITNDTAVLENMIISIIHLLYNSIPKLYKEKYPYIIDIDKAGNPLFYYMSILHYLNNMDQIQNF